MAESTENQKQAVVIEIEVRNAILEYLNERPHKEVRRFIDILAQAPIVNVTVTDTPNPVAAPDENKLASAARSANGDGKKTAKGGVAK